MALFKKITVLMLLLVVGLVIAEDTSIAAGTRFELATTAKLDAAYGTFSFWTLRQDGVGGVVGIIYTGYEDDVHAVALYHETLFDTYLGRDFGFRSTHKIGVGYLSGYNKLGFIGGSLFEIYWRRLGVYSAYNYASTLRRTVNGVYLGVSYQAPFVIF